MAGFDAQFGSAPIKVKTYDLDAAVRVTTLFKEFDDVTPRDPDVVKLTITSPATGETTYTYGVGAVIQKTSTGSYYANIIGDQSGTWSYKWWGTTSLGVGQGAKKKNFMVAA